MSIHASVRWEVTYVCVMIYVVLYASIIFIIIIMYWSDSHNRLRIEFVIKLTYYSSSVDRSSSVVCLTVALFKWLLLSWRLVRKAPGIDGVMAEHVLNCHHSISLHLQALFNANTAMSGLILALVLLYHCWRIIVWMVLIWITIEQSLSGQFCLKFLRTVYQGRI